MAKTKTKKPTTGKGRKTTPARVKKVETAPAAGKTREDAKTDKTRNPIGQRDCGICEVGAMTGFGGKPGVVIFVNGDPVLYNDYPNQGGPWALAFDGNGTPVWVNQGG